MKADQLANGAWRLDPEHSEVEFAVRHFWGLMTVKGHFDRYDGQLRLGSEPAIELVIEAASLDTGNAKRDEHLRSGDFFDVEHHPKVVFTSESAALDGSVLKVRGALEAAGRSVPMSVEAGLSDSGRGLELSAETELDHRDLGMNWSPMGMLRAPARLIVRGRLVPVDDLAAAS